jgi:predicted TPR repeat methyltransferase
MELTIDQALLNAVEAHKAGKLQVAESLYRAILQTQPNHPDANHNLGVLAVSVNKSEAALPLFKIALEASPQQVQFWISYVDALMKEKQFDNARNVLEQGKKQGLTGEKVDALETQLMTILLAQSSEASANKPPTFTQQRKKISGKKEKKKNSSSNQKNPNQIRRPAEVELNVLLENYQKGRFDLALNLAEKLTQQYPEHQFGWKVLGAVFKQTGRLQESLIANQRAVAISPNDAQAHSNLGLTLQELGRLEDAEVSNKRAIAIKPDYAEAHFNLGNTLQELGRLEDAEISYKKAIAIKPDYAEAHSNLGNTLQELGRLEDAEISYKKAIAIKPDYAEAHSNLGNTLQELGRLEDAETSYKKAIAIKPEYAEAHSNLGNTLKELGRLEDAETSYKKAIAFKPDYAEKLSHAIASISGLNPARATDAYVSNLFDDYAKKFESNLVGKLNYKTPTIIADLLRPIISPINQQFDILDLGCGTGLAGEALISIAKTLVGIDISKEMLGIAKAKNIYHRLIQDEIHHALSQELSASFDLVVSSDVFVYIGDIKAIFDKVYDVLKVGGFFAYSTEALYPASHGKEEFLLDYKLNQNGRYAHSSKYLLGLIDSSQFTLHMREVAQIRIEKGQPVMGYIVIMQKK